MLKYYFFFVILSSAFTLIYIGMMNRRRLSIYYTAMQILVPLINLGCFWTASATTLEGGLLGQKLTYLGGVFLPPLVFSSVAAISGVKLKKGYKICLYLVAFLLYASIVTCENHTLFYTSLDYHMSRGILVLDKTYGIMHTVVYGVIGLYVVGVGGILAYSLFKRKNATSLRTLYLLVLTTAILFVAFFARKRIMPEADPVLVYTVAQGMFLIIAARSYRYQIDDVIMDSMNQMGELGCIVINRYYEFLGANDTAREWFPEITDSVIDLPISSREGICYRLYGWIKNVEILGKGIETSYKPEGSKYLYRILVDRIDQRGGYKILIQKAEKEW